jgi:hypothetical protein
VVRLALFRYELNALGNVGERAKTVVQPKIFATLEAVAFYELRSLRQFWFIGTLLLSPA